MDAHDRIGYPAAVRIALVTPYLPCPANTGGRIRIHELARGLAREGRVSLYACAGVRETAAQRHRPELVLYERVRVRNSDLGCVWPWVTSRRVRRCAPARLAWDFHRDHVRAPFDVVVVEHSYAAAIVAHHAAIPCVLDEHNLESAYQRAYDAAEGRAPSREVALLAAWERDRWQRADLVTCVSEGDATSVRLVRAGPVDVIPNGTTLADVRYVPPSQRTGNDVLFVGLMSHAPNMKAGSFLAHEVMPRVWREVPEARLVLCGRSPAREIEALRSARVEVTGTLESVRPFLDRAAVYANALFHGAGTSLKVPEALASGIPMVSTAVGVRGFPLVAGEHHLEANDAETFAQSIVRVLRTRARFDPMAQRAREIAEGYDWGALSARFASRVVEIARARQR